MAFSERDELRNELFLEYLDRFGKCFGVPFHAFDFGTEDFIESFSTASKPACRSTLTARDGDGSRSIFPKAF